MCTKSFFYGTIKHMLEVKNVKVEYYGEELAVLNFAFEKGVTLILGEVGSFKSTLFRIIGGIKEIPDGEIAIDGRQIEEVPPRERNMAYVGLDSTPEHGKTVKNLMKPLRLRGVNRREALTAATEAAKRENVPLVSMKRLTRADLLSFFRARLSLRETQVTMFDEPYHYFGEENADRITDTIRSRGGYTLVSSCDGGDIERLKPDYLVIVRQDKVLQSGKTEDVLAAPMDTYVELLIK